MCNYCSSKWKTHSPCQCCFHCQNLCEISTTACYLATLKCYRLLAIMYFEIHVYTYTSYKN